MRVDHPILSATGVRGIRWTARSLAAVGILFSGFAVLSAFSEGGTGAAIAIRPGGRSIRHMRTVNPTGHFQFRFRFCVVFSRRGSRLPVGSGGGSHPSCERRRSGPLVGILAAGPDEAPTWHWSDQLIERTRKHQGSIDIADYPAIPASLMSPMG